MSCLRERVCGSARRSRAAARTERRQPGPDENRCKRSAPQGSTCDRAHCRGSGHALVDSETSSRCRASTSGGSGEDPKGVTVSPDLGDAPSMYSGYVGVFNKLFKKGQPEATPVSAPQAGPMKAAAVP